jgi:hypothetical protein
MNATTAAAGRLLAAVGSGALARDAEVPMNVVFLLADENPTVEELYDLRRDPQELENLAGRPSWAPILARLRESWAQWRENAR